MELKDLSGAGLGLRRDIHREILALPGPLPRFLEIAPENWMEIGGHWRRVLDAAREKLPLTCHGLSLSIGSPEPLDRGFVRRLKRFFDDVGPLLYSEHLSYSKCDNAHLHDLLPIPFRSDAISHAAGRIREVQDILERRIAIENVSYYAAPGREMEEHEFLTRVLEEADCDLLLDVNNVYVNAFNHRYDPKIFLSSIPLERVVAIHIAGHEQREPDLIVDTHGRAVIDPVFDLLEWTLPRIRPVPILLERDHNFPEMNELLGELSRIQSIADSAWEALRAA